MIRIEMSNVCVLKKFRFMSETLTSIFKQTFSEITIMTSEILILT